MNIVLLYGVVLDSTAKTFTLQVADETGTHVLCVGPRQAPHSRLSLRGRLRTATIDDTALTVVEVLSWLPWEPQEMSI